MTQSLEVIFGELGISQYLDAFLEQGFDSWETILDITESDLDVLGVKLGYRRKLQRRIANSRGVAPEASLVSPTQPSIEDLRLDPARPDAPKTDSREATTGGIAKRKYRRHPKPDENAPQRPPSAYVLFSNKMRDDLRGRNLTFTEIAKLVGEHWQNLPQADKKSFELEAQAAKDKYNNDLAEYKKTANYKKYTLYLHEFKAKHAHQSHDKEGAKRSKLSEVGGGSQNGITTSGTPVRMSRSRSRSGSEGAPESEPAPRQHMRFGSSVSARESHSAATPVSYYASVDDSIHSPSSLGPDRSSPERSPTVNTSPRDNSSVTHLRCPGWLEDSRNDQIGMQRSLPPLSDMLDQRNGPTSAGPSGESSGFPFPRIQSVGSPGLPPALVGGESRPQTLSKEISWAGSSSSGSSFGYPRTPVEGPLPIHALLSSKSEQQHESTPLFYRNPTPPDHKPPFPEQRVSSNPMPFVNAGFARGPSPMTVQQNPLPQQPTVDGYAAQPKAQRQPGAKSEPNLDGMSALLRAGEIVDRRAQ